MFKSGNVTIMVADFKKAVQFYVETLGLQLQHQVEGHFAQVEAPGLTIGLLHPTGEQGVQSGKSESISIGFEVQELESAIEVLKSRGVEFQHIMENNGTRLAHFNDPDGNLLYLICNR
ncbi:VOC family protein [Paenibacillus ehimensis]|uniref:VOC family protein n=1 Tax=Paenibacillus ehimensis TaxID=79264 RepID=A0ABT8V2F3_9BACL|nr:VOC family protein [Paenibacillus ehimensis]MDO3675610.1 VOC family protein [Paenibacillus ehimensis]